MKYCLMLVALVNFWLLLTALSWLARLMRNPILNRVLGGVMSQQGEPPMIPIQPGSSPVFKVTPTFSGDAFVLDGSRASVTTSDLANAPAFIDLTDDPEGTTFKLNLTPDAVITPDGEAIVVTWAYNNPDGNVATVQGTVTENGIVDDVTGGTFAQVA